MQVKRLSLKISPDVRRVISLSYNIDQENVYRIASILMKMEPDGRQKLLEQTLKQFSNRHRDLEGVLQKHFKELEPFLPSGFKLKESDRLLLASYFTKEYSVESAALFNPSIAPLEPLENGAQPFVLSLRATGEGHISSIEFLQGAIDNIGHLKIIPPPSGFATGPEHIRQLSGDHPVTEVRFPEEMLLSEQVIFPITDDESNGIEDLRLVRFEEDGEVTYYGTYTAYNGYRIQTKLMETKDFKTFRFHTLKGEAIQDKDMALFPQKINGKYAMISRQDGNNLFIMYSENLFEWQDHIPIMRPEMPWELSKIGNCGSPLKTEKGWLLITHGVGPMRKYQLGAALLDLENPQKVVARLYEPLLGPEEHEREGYVPNVVYTCGAMIHRDQLVLPYAMSDSASGMALFDLQELLQTMERESKGEKA